MNKRPKTNKANFSEYTILHRNIVKTLYKDIRSSIPNLPLEIGDTF